VAAYRAFIVGYDGHYKRVEVLDCADDATALEQAKQIAAGHDVEIWLQERQVGTLTRGKQKR
jgi:hypothetical protein